MRYRDRAHAGAELAAHLAHLSGARVVVLALPRGGVPVAAPVADALGAPLDVLVVRKVGAPGRPELGVGAVAEGTDEVTWSEVAADLGVDPDRMASTVAVEQEELRRRVHAYRGDRPLPDVTGKVVVLVDDGLATGVTAEAAARAVARRRPMRTVLAVPVGAPATVDRLRAVVDEVVCPSQPAALRAVGEWYVDFRQTTDDEVVRLLHDRADRRQA